MAFSIPVIGVKDFPDTVVTLSINIWQAKETHKLDSSIDRWI